MQVVIYFFSWIKVGFSYISLRGKICWKYRTYEELVVESSQLAPLFLVIIWHFPVTNQMDIYVKIQISKTSILWVVKLRTKLLVAAQLLFCFITYGSKMISFIKVKHPVPFVIAETDKEAVIFYENYGFKITSLGEKYPGVERFQCILKNK